MSGANDRAAVREVVEEWIASADADRGAVAACLASNPPLVTVAAFHCQQAAEKLLKGFMVLAGQRFRKVHDLVALGKLVRSRYPAASEVVRSVEPLTNWSIAYRYPGMESPPPPSIAELNAALETIDRLAAALRALKSGDKAGGRG